VARKRSKLPPEGLRLHFLFRPSEPWRALEREFGFDAVWDWLQRPEVRALLEAVLQHVPERPPGRPKGRTKITQELLTAMRAHIDAGDKKTTAARKVLEAAGYKGGELKAAADALVRLRNKQR
jgi:hypothetical protein